MPLNFVSYFVRTVLYNPLIVGGIFIDLLLAGNLQSYAPGPGVLMFVMSLINLVLYLECLVVDIMLFDNRGL